MSVLVSMQHIVELTGARDAMEVYMQMPPDVAGAAVVPPSLLLPHRVKDMWFPAEVVDGWVAQLSAQELRWARRYD